MIRWLIPFAMLASCRSIEGHYVGKPQTGDDIGGLPIVVERLRFLKVTYKKVAYDVLDSAGKKVGSSSDNREVTVEPVKVDEVYAIDLKRPLAGTIDYDVVFPDNKAYPKQIKGKVEDKTLEQVTALVDKLLEHFAVPPTPAALLEEEKQTLFMTSESVERIEFYDIEQLLAGGAVQPVLVLQ